MPTAGRSSWRTAASTTAFSWSYYRANNMVPRKRHRDEFLKVLDWDS